MSAYNDYGSLAVVVLGLTYNNSRISDLRSDINERFRTMEQMFNQRLDALDRTFDAANALRVEGDARLPRIEDTLRIRP